MCNNYGIMGYKRTVDKFMMIVIMAFRVNEVEGRNSSPIQGLGR
jgi:hypothetical protein